jgi:hypothetical protein
VTKTKTTEAPLAGMETAKAECHGDMRKFAFLQRCSAYRQRTDAGAYRFDDLDKAVTA